MWHRLLIHWFIRVKMTLNSSSSSICHVLGFLGMYNALSSFSNFWLGHMSGYHLATAPSTLPFPQLAPAKLSAMLVPIPAVQMQSPGHTSFINTHTHTSAPMHTHYSSLPIRGFPITIGVNFLITMYWGLQDAFVFSLVKAGSHSEYLQTHHEKLWCVYCSGWSSEGPWLQKHLSKSTFLDEYDHAAYNSSTWEA